MDRQVLSSSPAEATSARSAKSARPRLGLPATRLSRPAGRALATGLVGLAVLPASLLVGCGNQAHKQSIDRRPEPQASTDGARVATPEPAGNLATAGPTVDPQQSLGPPHNRPPNSR